MGVNDREEEGIKGVFFGFVLTIKTFITLTHEVYTFYLLRYFF